MKRVVLIEDSLDARNYVRDHAPADWKMLEAADGLSGLDLVRQWLPALDLVILDMMLPDVDGEYVCAQIRELSQTLPILREIRLKAPSACGGDESRVRRRRTISAQR